MHVVVVPLRRRGIRLSRKEIDSGTYYEGDLSIKDVRDDPLSRRAARVAELRPTNPRDRKSGDVLPALFDPVLVRMKGDTLLLVGYEVHNLYDRKGSMADYVQSWLVRVVRDLDEPVPF